jgi:hypothetical protein
MSEIGATQNLVEMYDKAAANLPMETNLIKTLSDKDQIFLYQDKGTSNSYFVKIVNIPKRIELQRVKSDGNPEFERNRNRRKKTIWGVEKPGIENLVPVEPKELKHLFLNFDENNKLYPFSADINRNVYSSQAKTQEPPVDEDNLPVKSSSSLRRAAQPLEGEGEEKEEEPTPPDEGANEGANEGGGKKKTRRKTRKNNRKTKKSKKNKRKVTRRL